MVKDKECFNRLRGVYISETDFVHVVLMRDQNYHVTSSRRSAPRADYIPTHENFVCLDSCPRSSIMSELRRSNRRSHPSLKAREMAPPTKKVRWSKTLNDSAQDPAAEESDDSALDGDGMSPCIKNALYLLPDRAEPNRPWNIYDFVDPAPKFRVVGKGGEKLVDKSPGENASPVPAKGYQYVPMLFHDSVALLIAESPSYMITLVINENYNFMNPSDRSIPCNLDVKGVIFDSDPPDDPRKLELERAVALNGEVRFTINGGYYRVILGFQREIDLALEDEEDTTPCLFRAMYLLRVLSEFGQELVDAPAGSVTPEWRSRVLNPLLQRQLRGIYDHDSDRIEKEVGPSREDAHKFYLTHDPLDYGVGRRLRHNLLYLWQVRWSLGYIDKNGMHHRATSEDYYRTLASTKMLVNHRKVVTEGEAEDMVLSKSEGEVIDEEGIFCYYEDLVREAVSGFLQGRGLINSKRSF